VPSIRWFQLSSTTSTATNTTHSCHHADKSLLNPHNKHNCELTLWGFGAIYPLVIRTELGVAKCHPGELTLI
jgi:hypothetical protein